MKQDIKPSVIKSPNSDEDDYDDDFEASESLVEDLSKLTKANPFKSPLPLISDIGISKPSTNLAPLSNQKTKPVDTKPATAQVKPASKVEPVAKKKELKPMDEDDDDFLKDDFDGLDDDLFKIPEKKKFDPLSNFNPAPISQIKQPT